MKNTLFGIIILAVILPAGCTKNPTPDNGQNAAPANENSNAPPANNGPAGNQGYAIDTSNLPKYSLEEVATHNTPADCWIVLNNNVYNFSPQLANPNSPFAQNIASSCGTNATATFQNMRGPGGFGNPGDANGPRDYNGPRDFNRSRDFNSERPNGPGGRNGQNRGFGKNMNLIGTLQT